MLETENAHKQSDEGGKVKHFEIDSCYFRKLVNSVELGAKLVIAIVNCIVPSADFTTVLQDFVEFVTALCHAKNLLHCPHTSIKPLETVFEKVILSKSLFHEILCRIYEARKPMMMWRRRRRDVR